VCYLGKYAKNTSFKRRHRVPKNINEESEKNPFHNIKKENEK